MSIKEKLPSFQPLKIVISVLTIFLLVAIIYFSYKQATQQTEGLTNTANILGGETQFVRQKDPVFDGIVKD